MRSAWCAQDSLTWRGRGLKCVWSQVVSSPKGQISSPGCTCCLGEAPSPLGLRMNLRWDLRYKSFHKRHVLRGVTPGSWAGHLPLLGTQDPLSLVSGCPAGEWAEALCGGSSGAGQRVSPWQPRAQVVCTYNLVLEI